MKKKSSHIRKLFTLSAGLALGGFALGSYAWAADEQPSSEQTDNTRYSVDLSTAGQAFLQEMPASLGITHGADLHVGAFFIGDWQVFLKQLEELGREASQVAQQVGMSPGALDLSELDEKVSLADETYQKYLAQSTDKSSTAFVQDARHQLDELIMIRFDLVRHNQELQRNALKSEQLNQKVLLLHQGAELELNQVSSPIEPEGFKSIPQTEYSIERMQKMRLQIVQYLVELDEIESVVISKVRRESLTELDQRLATGIHGLRDLLWKKRLEIQAETTRQEALESDLRSITRDLDLAEGLEDEVVLRAQVANLMPIISRFKLATLEVNQPKAKIRLQAVSQELSSRLAELNRQYLNMVKEKEQVRLKEVITKLDETQLGISTALKELTEMNFMDWQSSLERVQENYHEMMAWLGLETQGLDRILHQGLFRDIEQKNGNIQKAIDSKVAEKKIWEQKRNQALAWSEDTERLMREMEMSSQLLTSKPAEFRVWLEKWKSSRLDSEKELNSLEWFGLAEKKIFYQGLHRESMDLIDNVTLRYEQAVRLQEEIQREKDSFGKLLQTYRIFTTELSTFAKNASIHTAEAIESELLDSKAEFLKLEDIGLMPTVYLESPDSKGDLIELGEMQGQIAELFTLIDGIRLERELFEKNLQQELEQVASILSLADGVSGQYQALLETLKGGEPDEIEAKSNELRMKETALSAELQSFVSETGDESVAEKLREVMAIRDQWWGLIGEYEDIRELAKVKQDTIQNEMGQAQALRDQVEQKMIFAKEGFHSDWQLDDKYHKSIIQTKEWLSETIVSNERLSNSYGAPEIQVVLAENHENISRMKELLDGLVDEYNQFMTRKRLRSEDNDLVDKLIVDILQRQRDINAAIEKITKTPLDDLVIMRSKYEADEQVLSQEIASLKNQTEAEEVSVKIKVAIDGHESLRHSQLLMNEKIQGLEDAEAERQRLFAEKSEKERNAAEQWSRSAVQYVREISSLLTSEMDSSALLQSRLDESYKEAEILLTQGASLANETGQNNINFIKNTLPDLKKDISQVQELWLLEIEKKRQYETRVAKHLELVQNMDAVYVQEKVAAQKIETFLAVIDQWKGFSKEDLINLKTVGVETNDLLSGHEYLMSQRNKRWQEVMLRLASYSDLPNSKESLEHLSLAGDEISVIQERNHINLEKILKSSQVAFEEHVAHQGISDELMAMSSSYEEKKGVLESTSKAWVEMHQELSAKYEIWESSYQIFLENLKSPVDRMLKEKIEASQLGYQALLKDVQDNVEDFLAVEKTIDEQRSEALNLLSKWTDFKESWVETSKQLPQTSQEIQGFLQANYPVYENYAANSGDLKNDYFDSTTNDAREKIQQGLGEIENGKRLLDARFDELLEIEKLVKEDARSAVTLYYRIQRVQLRWSESSPLATSKQLMHQFNRSRRAHIKLSGEVQSLVNRTNDSSVQALITRAMGLLDLISQDANEIHSNAEVSKSREFEIDQESQTLDKLLSEQKDYFQQLIKAEDLGGHASTDLRQLLAQYDTRITHWENVSMQIRNQYSDEEIVKSLKEWQLVKDAISQYRGALINAIESSKQREETIASENEASLNVLASVTSLMSQVQSESRRLQDVSSVEIGVALQQLRSEFIEQAQKESSLENTYQDENIESYLVEIKKNILNVEAQLGQMEQQWVEKQALEKQIAREEALSSRFLSEFEALQASWSNWLESSRTMNAHEMGKSLGEQESQFKILADDWSNQVFKVESALRENNVRKLMKLIVDITELSRQSAGYLAEKTKNEETEIQVDITVAQELYRDIKDQILLMEPHIQATNENSQQVQELVDRQMVLRDSLRTRLDQANNRHNSALVTQEWTLVKERYEVYEGNLAELEMKAASLREFEVLREDDLLALDKWLESAHFIWDQLHEQSQQWASLDATALEGSLAKMRDLNNKELNKKPELKTQDPLVLERIAQTVAVFVQVDEGLSQGDILLSRRKDQEALREQELKILDVLFQEAKGWVQEQYMTWQQLANPERQSLEDFLQSNNKGLEDWTVKLSALDLKSKSDEVQAMRLRIDEELQMIEILTQDLQILIAKVKAQQEKIQKDEAQLEQISQIWDAMNEIVVFNVKESATKDISQLEVEMQDYMSIMTTAEEVIGAWNNTSGEPKYDEAILTYNDQLASKREVMQSIRENIEQRKIREIWKEATLLSCASLQSEIRERSSQVASVRDAFGPTSWKKIEEWLGIYEMEMEEIRLSRNDINNSYNDEDVQTALSLIDSDIALCASLIKDAKGEILKKQDLEKRIKLAEENLGRDLKAVLDFRMKIETDRASFGKLPSNELGAWIQETEGRSITLIQEAERKVETGLESIRLRDLSKLLQEEQGLINGYLVKARETHRDRIRLEMMLAEESESLAEIDRMAKLFMEDLVAQRSIFEDASYNEMVVTLEAVNQKGRAIVNEYQTTAWTETDPIIRSAMNNLEVKLSEVDALRKSMFEFADRKKQWEIERDRDLESLGRISKEADRLVVAFGDEENHFESKPPEVSREILQAFLIAIESLKQEAAHVPQDYSPLLADAGSDLKRVFSALDAQAQSADAKIRTLENQKSENEKILTNLRLLRNKMGEQDLNIDMQIERLLSLKVQGELYLGTFLSQELTNEYVNINDWLDALRVKFESFSKQVELFNNPYADSSIELAIQDAGDIEDLLWTKLSKLLAIYDYASAETEKRTKEKIYLDELNDEFEAFSNELKSVSHNYTSADWKRAADLVEILAKKKSDLESELESTGNFIVQADSDRVRQDLKLKIAMFESRLKELENWGNGLKQEWKASEDEVHKIQELIEAAKVILTQSLRIPVADAPSEVWKKGIEDIEPEIKSLNRTAERLKLDLQYAQGKALLPELFSLNAEMNQMLQTWNKGLFSAIEVERLFAEARADLLSLEGDTLSLQSRIEDRTVLQVSAALLKQEILKFQTELASLKERANALRNLKGLPDFEDKKVEIQRLIEIVQQTLERAVLDRSIQETNKRELFEAGIGIDIRIYKSLIPNLVKLTRSTLIKLQDGLSQRNVAKKELAATLQLYISEISLRDSMRGALAQYEVGREQYVEAMKTALLVRDKALMDRAEDQSYFGGVEQRIDSLIREIESLRKDLAEGQIRDQKDIENISDKVSRIQDDLTKFQNRSMVPSVEKRYQEVSHDWEDLSVEWKLTQEQLNELITIRREIDEDQQSVMDFIKLIGRAAFPGQERFSQSAISEARALYEQVQAQLGKLLETNKGLKNRHSDQLVHDQIQEVTQMLEEQKKLFDLILKSIEDRENRESVLAVERQRRNAVKLQAEEQLKLVANSFEPDRLRPSSRFGDLSVSLLSWQAQLKETIADLNFSDDDETAFEDRSYFSALDVTINELVQRVEDRKKDGEMIERNIADRVLTLQALTQEVRTANSTKTQAITGIKKASSADIRKEIEVWAKFATRIKGSLGVENLAKEEPKISQLRSELDQLLVQVEDQESLSNLLRDAIFREATVREQLENMGALRSRIEALKMSLPSIAVRLSKTSVAELESISVQYRQSMTDFTGEVNAINNQYEDIDIKGMKQKIELVLSELYDFVPLLNAALDEAQRRAAETDLFMSESSKLLNDAKNIYKGTLDLRSGLASKDPKVLLDEIRSWTNRETTARNQFKSLPILANKIEADERKKEIQLVLSEISKLLAALTKDQVKLDQSKKSWLDRLQSLDVFLARSETLERDVDRASESIRSFWQQAMEGEVKELELKEKLDETMPQVAVWRSSLAQLVRFQVGYDSSAEDEEFMIRLQKIRTLLDQTQIDLRKIEQIEVDFSDFQESRNSAREILGKQLSDQVTLYQRLSQQWERAGSNPEAKLIHEIHAQLDDMLTRLAALLLGFEKEYGDSDEIPEFAEIQLQKQRVTALLGELDAALDEEQKQIRAVEMLKQLEVIQEKIRYEHEDLGAIRVILEQRPTPDGVQQVKRFSDRYRDISGLYVRSNFNLSTPEHIRLDLRIIRMLEELDAVEQELNAYLEKAKNLSSTIAA